MSRSFLKLGGGSSADEIDWGIEQFDEWKRDFKHDHQTLSVWAKEDSRVSSACEMLHVLLLKHHDPAVVLLRYLGYTTVEYTKDKEIPSGVALATNVQARSYLCTERAHRFLKST